MSPSSSGGISDLNANGLEGINDHYHKRTFLKDLAFSKMQTIDVLSKISEIQRDEWDRLIRTNVFATQLVPLFHFVLSTVSIQYFNH
jgi:hypothetical protein